MVIWPVVPKDGTPLSLDLGFEKLVYLSQSLSFPFAWLISPRWVGSGTLCPSFLDNVDDFGEPGVFISKGISPRSVILLVWLAHVYLSDPVGSIPGLLADRFTIALLALVDGLALMGRDIA